MTDTLGGVQIHSSESAGNSYVVFASQYGESTIARYLRNLGASYKAIQGCYKGETEQAYIVNLSRYTATEKLTLDQESVLVLGPVERVSFVGANGLRQSGARPATLHFLKGRLPESLGYLIPVSEEEAKAQDAWSFSDGQYYICRHIGSL